MSETEVRYVVARALINSLIERLVPDGQGNFTLAGGVISASDLDALKLLSRIDSDTADDKPASVQSAAPRFGAPAVVSDRDLNLACLSAEPSGAEMLAVDFGTAFSKAAVWKTGAEDPTPLELRNQVSDIGGLMLDSCVYVTDGAIYFGAQAQTIFRQENASGRRLFDSPKGELSVLRGANLQQPAPPEIDPTGMLSKHDLLTLYLAYLMGATSSALEAVGCERYCSRRYAVPVWEQGKLDDISGVLGRELVDAQILADSLPVDAWRQGLSVTQALALLRRLRETVSDDQRLSVKFIEGHVLEAAAAAASVGERLANRRPVALVLDVGAGTTDVGLYRFALPPSGPFKVFPFQNGRGASTYAGNVLDQQIVGFIKNAAGIDPDTSDGQRVAYALSRDIRVHKANLFQAGFVSIEELDGRRIELAEFLASPQALAFRKQLKQKITSFLDQVGFERMSNPDGLHGVITGGGANASIFRDLFDEPFNLTDGDAKFELLDVQPSWITERKREYAPIFPQLAVSVGGCSPELPEERNAITDASSAPVRTAEVTYR